MTGVEEEQRLASLMRERRYEFERRTAVHRLSEKLDEVRDDDVELCGRYRSNDEWSASRRA
jgi:hypothetical protein